MGDDRETLLGVDKVEEDLPRRASAGIRGSGVSVLPNGAHMRLRRRICKVYDQAWIVVILSASTIFTLKIYWLKIYAMYEQSDGMATVGVVRMSRPTEATRITGTHERHPYDQAFM